MTSETQPEPTEPDFAAPQRRVQRWLGRCLLMLQQYERLLKAMLHNMQFEAWRAGTDDAGRARFEQRRAFESDALRSMTLGILVKHFTGQFLAEPEPQPALPEDGSLRMRVRWSHPLPPDEHQRLADGLRELVGLRNLLVHHFIEQFDLQTVSGCAAAQQALEQHYARVLAHWEELRTLAQHLGEASEHMTRFLQSPQTIELLTTGKVTLTGASVVEALRQTLAALVTRAGGSDETVDLADLVAAMRARYPDETPERYGRGSWPQLIHDAGAFELRRSRTANGRRRVGLKSAPGRPPAPDPAADVSAPPPAAAPPAPRTPAPPRG